MAKRVHAMNQTKNAMIRKKEKATNPTMMNCVKMMKSSGMANDGPNSDMDSDMETGSKAYNVRSIFCEAVLGWATGSCTDERVA
mgnify:CR=1 FL=1